MAAHSGASWGTVEETIDASRSASPTPRSSSSARRRAPSSSAVDSRTVAKRQCSSSCSPRNVPKCVWVLPTSTTSSIPRVYARPMALKVFVVHGSHPCATVLRALELKGIEHGVVELPPPLHAPIQRALFGARTVPAVRFEDGEKLSGSRAILARLDELAPAPALLPADPEARAAVLRAEEWGDEVLQPIARRLLWPAMLRRPGALASYSRGSKVPAPAPLLRLVAPVATRAEM